MKFDLKEVVEQHKTDDGLNYEAVMKSIDEQYVNPIIASKKPNVEKIQAEYVGTIAQDLGIEGNTVDDIKLWAKKMGGNTDEIKEANLTLEKQLKEYKTNFEQVNNEYSTLKQSHTEMQRLSKINGLGILGEDAEFLNYKLSKQVTEEKTFESLLEEYAKENKPSGTTMKFQKKRGFDGGKSDFLQAFEDRKKKGY